MRITLAAADLTPERPARTWPAGTPTLVAPVKGATAGARYRLLAGPAPTDATVRARCLTDAGAIQALEALASDSAPIDRLRKLRLAATLSPHLNAPQLAALLEHRDPAEVWRWGALGRAHSTLREAVLAGELTMGHARYLLGMSQGEQSDWTTRARRGRWSVRKLATAIRQGGGAEAPSSADIQAVETRIGERLGATVRVHWPDDPVATRKLVIDWYDVESLKGILTQLAAGPEIDAAQAPVQARQLVIPLQNSDELSALTQHLLEG